MRKFQRKQHGPIRSLRTAVIQSLESRRLMAAVSVVNGELTLTGDAARANTIGLTLSSNAKTYTATVNSTTQTVAASGVREVHVLGGPLGDRITLGSTITADSVIEPGAGNDTVTGAAGSDNVFDTAGSNTFTLNGGADFVSGGSGNDTINGGDGNDVAFGNAGADRFVGAAGDDTFDGGDGLDSADGGAGTDVALNTETRTTVELHPGLGLTPAGLNVSLSGGTLNVTGLASTANVVNVAVSGGSLVVTANATRHTFAKSAVTKIAVTGGSKADFVRIDPALGVPVSVNAGAGDDTVMTAGGNDTIVGGDGDDRITTQGGNDSITGGIGDDTLDAGSGNDTLTGDGGTDVADGGAGTDSGAGLEYQVGVEKTLTTPTPTPTPTPPTPTPPTPTPPTPGNPSAVVPTPVITAMQTTIVAGQTLFVHGMNSRLGVGTADTAHFEWNFGDAAGAYNTLVGFNAGHIYDRAGTYTVTLKLYNQDGGYKAATLSVHVTAAARKTYYVSAAGSDGNDGTSPTKAVKTYKRAAALVGGQSNVAVLFRKGDIFTTTSALLVKGDNVTLGTYGSGNKPIIKWNGARGTNSMITVDFSATGTTVDGLAIDSVFTGPDGGSRGGMPYGIIVRGTATAVRNTTFYNVGYAVQTNSGPTGVLVQGCDSPTAYGLRSYLVWCQGSDFVLLGNKVVNSTDEHPIRVFGVDRLLIAYNDLANPQAYGFETSKTALNIQKGNDVYVYGNTLRGPRWQIGPLGGADGINDKGARLNDIVVENNKLIDTDVQIYHGAQNVYIRNNVFQYKDNNAIEVSAFDTTYNRGVVNLNIDNNTFVNTGTQGRVLYVKGNVNGIALVNNLYRADNMYVGTEGTAAIYVNDTSLHSFKTISNNLWPVPTVTRYVALHTPGGTGFAIVSHSLNDLANYFNITRWNALSPVGTDYQNDVTLDGSYKPTSDLDLIASGVKNVAGVFGDYNGKARPRSGVWSIGAIQI